MIRSSIIIALMALLFALPAAGQVTSNVILDTTATWNGVPIAYLKSQNPQVKAIVVEIPAGEATPWHQHPVNNLAYILEGSLKLELQDGTSRVFQKGESFAEVVNTLHRGINIGQSSLKILVFYLSETGMPITTYPAEKEKH